MNRLARRNTRDRDSVINWMYHNVLGQELSNPTFGPDCKIAICMDTELSGL